MSKKCGSVCRFTKGNKDEQGDRKYTLSSAVIKNSRDFFAKMDIETLLNHSFLTD